MARKIRLFSRASKGQTRWLRSALRNETTGGVLLLGVGLRLLQIRAVAVGNMLPALIVAPLVTLVLLSF
jgi:uncharacterized membrane protein YqgA involved in biofilm formation